MRYIKIINGKPVSLEQEQRFNEFIKSIEKILTQYGDGYLLDSDVLNELARVIDDILKSNYGKGDNSDTPVDV